MGFFSSLLRTVGRVAGSFLGIAPRAAPVAARVIRPSSVAQPFVAATRAIGRAAISPAGQLGLGVAAAGAGGAIGAALAAPGGAGAPTTVMGGVGRGNGQFARQTVVQTIDLASGRVVRQEVFSGAPFLMQKAVRELRSTTKKLSRAHAKIPRKTRMQSKNSMLVNAVLDRALSQVASCPTTSHG